MTKIMLVEDDKSLREIYGVRLFAEGYDIVSAGDGEEALAMAIKERPQLIISDVMMPKISGFDLLDILRSTTETKNIRFIMMTALSAEDQRQRGEQLGADRYLVKSQLGIEDVVRVVHEVLQDQTYKSPQAVYSNNPADMPQPNPSVPGIPPTQFAPQPGSSPLPPPAGTMPNMAFSGATPSGTPPQSRSRIIEPIADPTAVVNLNELVDKEIAKEAGLDMNQSPAVASTAQTQSLVDQQIDKFAETATESTSLSEIPTIAVSSEGVVNTAIAAPDTPAPVTPPPATNDIPQSVSEPQATPPAAPQPAPVVQPAAQAPDAPQVAPVAAPAPVTTDPAAAPTPPPTIP